MERLVVLNNSDIEQVIEFLNKEHISNAIILGHITKYGMENNPSIKRSGTYYGFYVDNNLRGVFAFINTGCLYLYFEDDKILNKIILLKTIKHHKPKNISGLENLVMPLWKRLEKTAKCLRFEECNYMVLNTNRFVPYYGKNKIIDSKEYDFSKSLDFLIHVEKAFDRNPNTVNDLKSKILNRDKEENYLFLIEDDKIVSQGLIQISSLQMSEIGGIFTLPPYRGRYFGKALISRLCEIILTRNKIPFLIVNKSNERGNNLYKSLGFQHFSDYLAIEMQIM